MSQPSTLINQTCVLLGGLLLFSYTLSSYLIFLRFVADPATAPSRTAQEKHAPPPSPKAILNV